MSKSDQHARKVEWRPSTAGFSGCGTSALSVVGTNVCVDKYGEVG